MRVAVCQFATSLDTQENLTSCIRMINEAAVCAPDLLVLPECCNTQFSDAQPCYVDHVQAWDQALDLNGGFLQAIAEQAKKYSCYVVISVTLRREDSRDLLHHKQDKSIKSKISITSCLFSPDGKLIHQQDKKTLTAHENDFFSSANFLPEVITTPLGKIGLLAGNDDFIFAPSRELALSDAQLLCSAQSSFALDQSRIHGPARASENKVFIASANKIGPLVSQQTSVQAQIMSQSIQQENQKNLSMLCFIPPEQLLGVGQSQIVSPDGKILARISDNKEGFVFADIDLATCDASNSQPNKYRPDGTNLITQRRPELYQALTLRIKSKQQSLSQDMDNRVPTTVNAAIFATYKSSEQAIEDVCHYIENNLSDIIQLPELFFVEDKSITNNAEQLAIIECLSKQVIGQISAVLRTFQYICTSLVIKGVHQAVILSKDGLLATQQQLHFCQRYQWTALGDGLNIIELPLEQGVIHVAMLTADDANIPEIVNLAALNEIQVLLVPFDIQDPSEVEYCLLSRAAEHRICIVAASREKSFANELSSSNENNNIVNKNKVKIQKSTGFIANLATDSTLLSQWKSRKCTGYINQPLVKYQQGKITKALIHPIAAIS